MDAKEIKELVEKIVKEQVEKEKKKLASIIKNELEYTGEYAKCIRIMEAIDIWSRDN